MKGGFYAVKVGRIPGVYTTWAEAEQQVQGFPNAKHKKFSTEAEAREYVGGASSALDLNIMEELEQKVGSMRVDNEKLKKFYVVIGGVVSGNYTSRNEAKAQCEDCKESKRKSFTALDQAVSYMRDQACDRDIITLQGRATQDEAVIEELRNLLKGGEKSLIEQLRENHPRERELIAFCAASAPSNGQENATAAYATYFPLEQDLYRVERVRGKESNIRAYCCAALKATELASDLDPQETKTLVIYTQYQGLCSAMADHDGKPRWINKWQVNGWKTSGGGPVAHQDIYKLLLEAERSRDISWRFLDPQNCPTWLFDIYGQAHDRAETRARSAGHA
ncbi:unnamed protein product [Phytophthora lilii]|uniref:ribonuclease H n=1 Tax=Phytophthora lilii TaxID=2077276 RepID=A0A9W6TJD6_9STRA|nr:unnamed protein product [Phytophthora lilii]